MSMSSPSKTFVHKAIERRESLSLALGLTLNIPPPTSSSISSSMAHGLGSAASSSNNGTRDGLPSPTGGATSAFASSSGGHSSRRSHATPRSQGQSHSHNQVAIISNGLRSSGTGSSHSPGSNASTSSPLHSGSNHGSVAGSTSAAGSGSGGRHSPGESKRSPTATAMGRARRPQPGQSPLVDRSKMVITNTDVVGRLSPLLHPSTTGVAGGGRAPKAMPMRPLTIEVPGDVEPPAPVRTTIVQLDANALSQLGEAPNQNNSIGRGRRRSSDYSDPSSLSSTSIYNEEETISALTNAKPFT